MRGGMVVVGLVGLFGLVGLANGASISTDGLTYVLTAVPTPVVPREELVRVLSEREAELQELRRFKAQIAEEQAFYAEADDLGIVKMVKRTKLPEVQQRRLAIAIVREARKNGIDPLLVTAVIRCESSFNNYAVSHVGAMGLMQVMPDTGKYLAELTGGNLGQEKNLFDPETNVALGSWYLADLIKRFGTVEHALVAYNAGPGLAKRILAKKQNRVKFIAGYPTKVVSTFKKMKAEHAKLVQARAAATGSVTAQVGPTVAPGNI